jgi:diacylglycerol kinase family enzyme
MINPKTEFKEIIWVENSHSGNPFCATERNRILSDIHLPFRILARPAPEDLVSEKGTPPGQILVIAAGGDGTLHRILPALCRSGMTLLSAGGGTGNDFFRMIRNRYQPDFSLTERIRAGTTAKADLFSANGKLFATAGGIGRKSIEVIRLFSEPSPVYPLFKLFRRIFGRYSYVVCGTILTLSAFSMERETGTFTLTLDGANPFTLNLRDLFLTLIPEFGGVYRLPVMKPGLGTLIATSPRSYPDNLFQFIRILFKGFEENRRFETVRHFRNLEIHSPKPVPFFGDGEILFTSDLIRVSVLPDALKILI